MPKDIDRVPVPDMFCHASYGATHGINQAYAPMLKHLGLTYPQYIAMLTLDEANGLTVGQVSEKLKMKTSTVTPLLKRLETLGYLVRQRQKHDERKVLVSLTDAGRRSLQEAPEITACMISKTGLSEDDLMQLVDLLHRLTENLAAE